MQFVVDTTTCRPRKNVYIGNSSGHGVNGSQNGAKFYKEMYEEGSSFRRYK